MVRRFGVYVRPRNNVLSVRLSGCLLRVLVFSDVARGNPKVMVWGFGFKAKGMGAPRSPNKRVQSLKQDLKGGLGWPEFSGFSRVILSTGWAEFVGFSRISRRLSFGASRVNLEDFQAFRLQKPIWNCEIRPGNREISLGNRELGPGTVNYGSEL